VAKSLAGLHILDYFELDPHTSIVEIVTPRSITGKPLRELDLRKEYGVNVVCIKRGGEMDLSPGADTVLRKGDVLILSGRNEQLGRLERME
jgi:trk system potassium uptake protein TrkA